MRPYTLSTSNYCVSSVCKRNTTPVNLGLTHFGYLQKIQKYNNNKYKKTFVGRGYFEIRNVRTLCVQRKIPHHLFSVLCVQQDTTAPTCSFSLCGGE